MSTKHEMNLLRTTVINAFHHAARPHVVRRTVDGRCELVGRYATITEANAAAARTGGWVE